MERKARDGPGGEASAAAPAVRHAFMNGRRSGSAGDRTPSLSLLLIVMLILFGSMTAHAETTLTVVALGDSTTAGTPQFRSPVEVPPEGKGDERSQYAYWIMKIHPEWRVFNRGVNGERSDEILSRFDRDVLPFHPQVVIVLAGINDLYQGFPADYVKKKLAAIYERAQKRGIRIMACTILPYNGMSPSIRARMRDVNGWICFTAEEKGFGFCDLFHAVEDPKKRWHLIGSPDGLHPDVDGYRRMGEALIGPLEKLAAAPVSRKGISK